MEIKQKSTGVSFDIGFDDEKVARKCLQVSQRTKEPLTLDQIKEKQLLAEKRRQARIAARLQRMKEREEATKKLAENVEVLLQQQAIRNGEQKASSNVAKMSQKQLMKTANDVAHQFKIMQQQLIGLDLKIDEKMSHTTFRKTDKSTEKINNEREFINPCITKKAEINDHRKQVKGRSFEIPTEDIITLKTKQPRLVLKNKKISERELNVDKLHEKQQRAAERRQKRIEEKVRKTREGREALMELRTKINIYAHYNKAKETGNDGEVILSEQDAALLALEISNGFSNITRRYKSTLDNAEGFFMPF